MQRILAKQFHDPRELHRPKNLFPFLFADLRLEWRKALTMYYTRRHRQAEEKTKNFVANRDLVASKMTAAQIELAQRMASECQASNFKKCTVPK